MSERAGMMGSTIEHTKRTSTAVDKTLSVNENNMKIMYAYEINEKNATQMSDRKKSHHDIVYKNPGRSGTTIDMT